MPKLIKDKQIIDNTWAWLDLPDESPDSTAVADEPIIIPLAVWLAQREKLASRKSTLGVWLSSDQTADMLGADAQDLAIVALNFHSFMDGRLFSAARLLRERYGFKGELRATGHFIRDQLFYLKRCGVNAFAFADTSIDLNDCLASLEDFSESYQGAVDEPLPLFRRRA